jgi:hypothetical protein
MDAAASDIQGAPMLTNFFPLLSRLSRDPDAAWPLWRFLNDFSDALWDTHQVDFRQRFSDELQDDAWTAPADSAPDDQSPDSITHGPDDHLSVNDPSEADIW